MTNLTERIAALSPAKRVMLRKRQEQNKKQDAGVLSFAQQRLWFIHQLDPKSPAYNCPAVLKLTGSLNALALNRALEEIVRRHEVLRTTFPSREGIPFSEVSESYRVPMPMIDLAGASEAESIALRLVREEVWRPFSLAVGPLLRVLLLRLKAEEYILVVTAHHITTDGWSMGILVSELAALYRAFQEGKPSPLHDPAFQYSYYAAWQRRWLQGAMLEKQLAFWRMQLAGTPVLELPADRRRSSVVRHSAATVKFFWSAEQRDAWKSLGLREGATLFMTLLAGFKAVLGRYTGNTDIVVGTEVANRHHLASEGLIGFFVNQLALRTRLHSDHSFGRLLQQVRETALSAFAHQDVPFERVIEDLSPERDRTLSPLFNVALVVQNAPSGKLALPGVEVSEFSCEPAVAKMELVLIFQESDSGLSGALEYASDLFEAVTMERLIGLVQTLLAHAAENPGTRWQDLALMNKTDREQIYSLSVNPQSTRVSSVIRLFEQQALLRPEAVAVVDVNGQQQLSYGELNRRANQLARALRSWGTASETLVGVGMERGLEMIVALLGVLKAGAVYVPLDCSYPAERLAYMVQDSRLSVLLTQSHLRNRLPEHSARVICLDTEWEQIEQENGDNPALEIVPENLAYVIYTSGSTGQPKGVQVCHGGLANLLQSMQEDTGLGGKDLALAVSTLAFDISVLELFLPLIAGARIRLLSREASSDGRKLLEELEQGISVMMATPARWRMLVEAGWNKNRALKVLCGGEALSVELAEKLVERSGHVWNMYGPTEITVLSVMGEVEQVSEGVSLGQPIKSTQVYLLDENVELLPAGAIGEIYIGGAGLARGYLHQPDMTAEKFVPNQFSESGERLYRTGDLGRWKASGKLEFLGRSDDRVKVRGYRIEPGEIESLLVRHEAVREGVVAVHHRGSEGEDERLVAYVVATDSECTPTHKLLEYLRENLPEYMVPGAIVWMERLPLTPSGKVDRTALPWPESKEEQEPGRQMPRTAVEEIVAGVWAHVLGVKQVGLEENFFRLGGHSLLVTRVVSRLHQVMGVEMEPRSLFASPRLVDFARSVEQARAQSGGNAAPPIRRVTGGGARPLSYAQQRLWFIDQLDPGNVAYNIPLAVRLQGQLDIPALRLALSEVVRRHEVLRTKFVQVDGKAWQKVELALELEMPVEDLRSFPENRRQLEVSAKTAAEALRHFDLSAAPLVCTGLLQLGDQDYVLLLTMHHIVGDGWSAALLVKEATVIYEAFIQGKASPLSELEIQYGDYAVWQREWLAGEVLERHLYYWREQLKEMPALELLTDLPRPALPSYRGATESFVLQAEMVGPLREVCRAEGVTMFMLLLSAFCVVLGRWSGQDDIAAGTPIANRNRVETESLIGHFVNMLVLRGDLSGNPAFRQLLVRVREMCLGAYGHQDLPFEHLVSALETERDLSHTPLFQVSFGFQVAPVGGLSLPGLKVSEIEARNVTAKYDLSLMLTEADDSVRGSLIYSLDLYQEETARRLVRHLKLALAQVGKDPGRAVRQFALLSAEEQQELVEWNRTEHAYPESLCVHQMFEEQVRRNPEAVAVVFEDRQLSYGELNARANQLGHYLGQLGVWAEVRVGVCMERSVEMVVALLGVLKAGGAYVPLDPGYPAERLAYMLEDAGAAVLLTQEHLRGGLPTHWAQVICLDSEWRQIEQESAENSGIATAPEVLAYMIYTSGSTGQPKGTMVTHLGLRNHMEWITEEFELGAGDRVLQKTAFSFDASVWEFYAPLVRGGVLVMAIPGGHQDAAYLAEVMQREEITVLQAVPTMLEGLVEERGLGECRSLRYVFSGGEALKEQLRSKIQERVRVEVVNLYGPTEATIDATSWRGKGKGEGSRVAIGKPVWNTKVYVLDEEGEEVPLGVAGELYIGGAGVGRGYLERPELTGERFVPDGKSGEKGGRLYRTGDKARWRWDGNLEYLGRVDQQVKIRGYRIEPGEIESVLQQHPGVQRCVITTKRNQRDDQRLVAYVLRSATDSGNGDAPVESAELMSYLWARLPEYMLPTAFQFVKEFPQTPSGKLDLKALSGIEEKSAGTKEQYDAPRTRVERTLAAIWEKVLNIETVGMNDNFFERGGDSIIAIQVVARANEASLRIRPRQIFQHPTIAKLAEAIGAADSSLLPVQETLSGPTPLTPIQHWFFEQRLAFPGHFNQAIFLKSKGLLDPAIMEQVIAHLVTHHDALRTRFRRTGGAWEQENAGREDQRIFAVVDLSLVPDGCRMETMEQATRSLQASLNFETGPMLRVTQFQCGDADESRLLMAVHHLVIDVVSWHILLDDMQTAYRQLRDGKPVRLPLKTTSFQTWARTLVVHASAAAVQREHSYWVSQAQNGVRPLPVDFAGGVNSVASTRTVSVSLTRKETRNLVETLPAMTGAQVSDALLAALAGAITRWTGSRTTLVNLEGHGREEIESSLDLSRTVGWFTACYPVALHSGMDMAPGQVLQSVRDSVRKVPERGLGYGLLRYINKDQAFIQKIQNQPQPEINFNYMGQITDFDSESAIFAPALESPGPMQNESESRFYTFEIAASILGGSLKVTWNYSANLHRPSTIEQLADSFLVVLREFASGQAIAESGSAAPMVHDLDLTAKELAAITSRVTAHKSKRE